MLMYVQSLAIFFINFKVIHTSIIQLSFFARWMEYMYLPKKEVSNHNKILCSEIITVESL